jgi:hypothetical protein
MPTANVSHGGKRDLQDVERTIIIVRSSYIVKEHSLIKKKVESIWHRDEGNVKVIMK